MSKEIYHLMWVAVEVGTSPARDNEIEKRVFFFAVRSGRVTK